jgi:cytosine/adenosine deaminase-related metal-dependent hydrolase
VAKSRNEHLVPPADSSESRWTLRARWVFSVSAPPIADGVITIADDRIVAVEANARQTVDVDVGECAVLPGLVNAHTHLDLTGLRGQCPPGDDFPDWLRRVIRHRRDATMEQTTSDIRTGLTESLRCGTTLLGDISAGGISWSILAESPPRSVVFYELLGLTEAGADQSLGFARDWLLEHRARTHCRPGLSPHAPYSVRKTLFSQTAYLAQRYRIPLAVHLAESREELELLRDRQGPFVSFLKELGVWDENGLAASPSLVMKLCNRRNSLLFIHGNYLAPSARIPRNSTIVYCPRTHAAFEHAPHPFRRFLDRGIRVAIGTDSLASNPDLSVLAEIRYLRQQYPEIPGETLLRMATLSGAEALGWADETGSLEAGKSADLVVVPLSKAGGSDPHEQLLCSDLPVQRVLCRGRWLALAPALN